jgi:hypothetical protein
MLLKVKRSEKYKALTVFNAANFSKQVTPQQTHSIMETRKRIQKSFE